MTIRYFRLFHYVSFSFILFLLLTACEPDEVAAPAVEEAEFSSTPQTIAITPGLIDEVSGMADSYSSPGSIWVQQDGGNPSEIALLSHQGALVKRVVLKQAPNRDWEDMAMALDPSSGKQMIYLADIGDNLEEYQQYFIYVFPEPVTSATQVDNMQKITFTYPDGSHDAEAILVDASRREIFIITKRDQRSGLYKLTVPATVDQTLTATFIHSFDYNGVTSAALSPNGKEVIVKTYAALYHYKRNGSEPLPVTLSRKPLQLPYSMEPQGEALCFRNDDKGFYTLSEKGLAPAIDLRYYKRK